MVGGTSTVQSYNLNRDKITVEFIIDFITTPPQILCLLDSFPMSWSCNGEAMNPDDGGDRPSSLSGSMPGPVNSNS